MNAIQAYNKIFSFLNSPTRYLKKLGQLFQSGSINARTLLRMSPCWHSPFKANVHDVVYHSFRLAQIDHLGRSAPWLRRQQTEIAQISLRTQTYFRLSLLSAEKRLRTRAAKPFPWRTGFFFFSRWPIRLRDRMKLEWSTRRANATQLAYTMAYRKLIITAQNDQ